MSEELTQNLPNDGVGRILSRLDSIALRLTKLEEKVDASSYETKPIWEKALKEIMETRAEVVKVEDRLGRIENEIKDMRRMFRATFADVARVQEDLEERMEKIEGRESTQ
jgi:hypothetical protein